MLTSFQYKPSNYFDSVDYSSETTASRISYLDMLEENKHVDQFAISSKVVALPYMQVFIELTNTVEDNIFNFNPKLKPENDKRGLKSDMIIINETSWSTVKKQQKDYLETLNEVYSIRIASLDYPVEFILSENKHEDLGFETFVDIKHLNEGKHILKVVSKRIQEVDTLKQVICSIPFWYFRD